MGLRRDDEHDPSLNILNLDLDGDFLALAAGILTDRVVDAQGVYWLETLSGELRVGVQATKSD